MHAFTCNRGIVITGLSDASEELLHLPRPRRQGTSLSSSSSSQIITINKHLIAGYEQHAGENGLFITLELVTLKHMFKSTIFTIHLIFAFILYQTMTKYHFYEQSAITIQLERF
jgi:hypothetical protein